MAFEKRIKCGGCEHFRPNRRHALGIGRCRKKTEQPVIVQGKRGLFYRWDYPLYPNAKRFCALYRALRHER